jgi:hypothetical protein
MCRRGRILKRSVLLVAWLLVVTSSPALAAEVSVERLARRTGNATGSLHNGFVPQSTWLETLEGGSEDAALTTRVNPTTFVISSPGLGRDYGEPANGLAHCYGPGADTCEFISIGPLREDRRALRVNDSTVVMQGVGPDGEGCAGNGPADDILFIVRGLGAPGVTVQTDPALSKLCLFMRGTDPIRVDDDTAVFSQPRPAARFGTPAGALGDALTDRCDAPPDDRIIVVSGLRPGTTLRVTTLNVGSLLGVHLGGGPSGRAVRLSDTGVVWASPGADGQFALPPTGDDEADETDSLCGFSRTGDDGLVVLRLGTTGSLRLTWVPVGTLTGNAADRPLRVNDSAVVIASIGAEQGQEGGFGPSPLGESPPNDQIIVVEDLGQPHAKVTRFPGFGHMRRAVRLKSGSVVFFAEDTSAAKSARDVALTAHLVRGIRGGDSDREGDQICPSPDRPLSLVTVPIAIGHRFAVTDWTRQDVGVVLNCHQVVFWTTGPNPTDRQAFVLTDTGTTVPRLAVSTAAAGFIWDQVRATRINNDTVAYTVSKPPRPLGLLKASMSGDLIDMRLQLPPDATPSDLCAGGREVGGLYSPASQPVRLSNSRIAVVSKGKDGGFSKRPDPPHCPAADDGLIIVEGADTDTPTTRYVGFWNSCGGHGCKPLALGTPGHEIVVVGGSGRNLEIQEGEDDEVIIVTLP